LADSEIIDVTKIESTGRVIFGSTITLLNVETDESVTYKIVGEGEADVPSGKISVVSPIARAVMGKNEGDEVVVKVPAGDVQYEIGSVLYL
ncbi:MAG: GreA/GreB family elongation factor, partial [Pseudomonadota bacterium]|nr:GreA/GreB family elongation factor [Pseudomonadota bacterium]